MSNNDIRQLEKNGAKLKAACTYQARSEDFQMCVCVWGGGLIWEKMNLYYIL